MDMIFGACGIIGGLLCACGDLLLDLKGKDNQKLGKHGFIDSAWDHMNIKRFEYSILFAMVGIPLNFLGMTALARQLGLANETFGFVFWLFAAFGELGGFFIHTIICLFPVMFKTSRKKHSFEDSEEIVNAVYEAIRIPFWLFYFSLAGATSIMVIWAMFAGYLSISPWFTLLTVPSLVIISVILYKLKPDWFYDLPFVIAPSLGMSAFGLFVILNQL